MGHLPKTFGDFHGKVLGVKKVFHLAKFPFVYALINKFKMVAQISPLNSLELVTTCVIVLHEKFL